MCRLQNATREQVITSQRM